MALYQDLHRLVLDVNNPRLGSVAKAFAAKHGSKFESLCGKSWHTTNCYHYTAILGLLSHELMCILFLQQAGMVNGLPQ